MNKVLKWIVGIAAVLILIAWLAQGLMRNWKRADPGKDEKLTEQAPSRVSMQGGEPVITLSREELARLGLSLATLHAASTRQEVEAPAVVLSVQDLTSKRDLYVSTESSLEKARLNVNVARKEYNRLKALYQENQNTSLKSLEMAEQNLGIYQAEVHTAEQQLSLQKAATGEKWGMVVADWLVNDSPDLQRVLSQQDLLVQVTLPAGKVATIPRSAYLGVPSERLVTARYLSAFPRVDPRVQGISLLYFTASHPGLAPGTNLMARLPAGGLMKGVVVSRQSVVWLNGNAWAYVQTSPTTFVRHRVSTDIPFGEGWFVTSGFAPGASVVTGGAQQLLAVELMPMSSSASEEGDAD